VDGGDGKAAVGWGFEGVFLLGIFVDGLIVSVINVLAIDCGGLDLLANQYNMAVRGC
jgi:hypothetical protein